MKVAADAIALASGRQRSKRRSNIGEDIDIASILAPILTPMDDSKAKILHEKLRAHLQYQEYEQMRELCREVMSVHTVEVEQFPIMVFLALAERHCGQYELAVRTCSEFLSSRASKRESEGGLDKEDLLDLVVHWERKVGSSFTMMVMCFLIQLFGTFRFATRTLTMKSWHWLMNINVKK